MYTSIFNSIIVDEKIIGGFYFSFCTYIFDIFLMECLLLGNRGKTVKFKKNLI